MYAVIGNLLFWWATYKIRPYKNPQKEIRPYKQKSALRKKNPTPLKVGFEGGFQIRLELELESVSDSLIRSWIWWRISVQIQLVKVGLDLFWPWFMLHI